MPSLMRAYRLDRLKCVTYLTVVCKPVYGVDGFFLPRHATRKRGSVSVRPSVCHVGGLTLLNGFPFLV